jgi:hypothetical protein
MSVSLTNQRAALVDSNGIVQNIIVWQDGDVAPEGFTVVVRGTTEPISIGWKHNGDNTFTDPNPPPPPLPEPQQPSLADLQAQLALIQAQISELAAKG